MAEFRMPSLGADMDAGTLVEWRVRPGDAVRRGDIVAEVETDKGLVEIEIFADGIIDSILVPEGRKVPVILFTKGGGQWLEAMADSGCDALGIDWTTDLKDARARVGSRIALQGNMDPSVLYASPQRIRAEAEVVLASFGQGSGHVFNLGHGIHTGINPDHVAVLVDAVHAASKKYHG